MGLGWGAGGCMGLGWGAQDCRGLGWGAGGCRGLGWGAGGTAGASSRSAAGNHQEPTAFTSFEPPLGISQTQGMARHSEAGQARASKSQPRLA